MHFQVYPNIFLNSAEPIYPNKSLKLYFSRIKYSNKQDKAAIYAFKVLDTPILSLQASQKTDRYHIMINQTFI